MFYFSGIYLAATLCVSSLATLLTVGLLFVHHKKGEPRIGSVYYIMSRGAGKLCCLKNKDGGSSAIKVQPSDEGMVDKPGSGQANSRMRTESRHDQPFTWCDIAEIWDRFCFIAFVVLTFILNIVFILVLAVGGANSAKA